MVREKWINIKVLVLQGKYMSIQVKRTSELESNNNRKNTLNLARINRKLKGLRSMEMLLFIVGNLSVLMFILLLLDFFVFSIVWQYNKMVYLV